jgi:hypothetical protein
MKKGKIVHFFVYKLVSFSLPARIIDGRQNLTLHYTSTSMGIQWTPKKLLY